jgi:ribosomal protein L37AE/L43A
MSNDFYCRYGKHWTLKEYKINTVRQGDYICSSCEDLRTKDWVKSQLFTRRKTDHPDHGFIDDD